MALSQSPYSIRFTEPQRAYIKQQAQAMKLSEAQWIRYRLFSETALTTTQQKLNAISPNKDLAQILYMLGQTRIANNLNQIAKAVNTGTLIISPDVYAQIDETYQMIYQIRQLLIKAQGLRA